MNSLRSALLYIFTLTTIFSIHIQVSNAQSADSSAIYFEQFNQAVTNKEWNNVIRIGNKGLKQEEDPKNQLVYIRKVAESHLRLRQYERSKYVYLRGIEIADSLGNLNEKAIYLNNLSRVYKGLNQKNQALKCIEEAASNYFSIQNYKSGIGSLLNASIIYRDYQFYDKAAEKLKTAYEYMEAHDEKSKLQRFYNLYGRLYTDQGNKNSALKYYRKAALLNEKNKDTPKLAVTLNHIGNLYKEFNKLDSADYYYNQALDLKKLNQDSNAIISTTINLGEIYLLQKQFEKAEEYLSYTITIAKSINDVTVLTSAMNFMAQVYASKGNCKAALETLRNNESNAYLLQDWEITYENLNAQVTTLNQCKQSQIDFHLLEKLLAAKDSIKQSKIKFNTTKALIETDLLKIEQEKKELESLTLLQETENQLLENRLILLITLILFILVFIFALIFKNRKQKQLNVELTRAHAVETQLKNDLQHLLNEQHHRTKNFLQTLISVFGLHQKNSSDQTIKAAVEESKNRLNAMILVHKKLGRPTIENSTQIELKEYLVDLIDQVVNSYAGLSEIIEKEIILERLYIDANECLSISIIVNEVLTNAYKYALPSNPKPFISIKVNTIDETLFISIKDNGPGIPEEYMDGKSSSLGVKLIRLFSQRIESDYHYDNTNGTTFRLKVKTKKAS